MEEISCGLNLNVHSGGIEFFFLSYTEKGGKRKIKEERRELAKRLREGQRKENKSS